MDTLAPDTATGPAADVASRGSATDPADHLPPPSAPPHPSVATLTGLSALLATGLGLMAAIPAVVFYNKLSADSDRIVGNYESFADEFATILSRQLDAQAA